MVGSVLINCVTVMKFLRQDTQEKRKPILTYSFRDLCPGLHILLWASWVGGTNWEVELEGEMNRQVLQFTWITSLYLMVQGFPITPYLLKGPQTPATTALRTKPFLTVFCEGWMGALIQTLANDQRWTTVVAYAGNTRT